MSLLDKGATRTTELSSLLELGPRAAPAPAFQTPTAPPPGWVERGTVILTIFVLLHGLPMDWFYNETTVVANEGNLRLVAVQLALMSLGIARVAGWFNWLIRVFQLDLTVISLAALAMTSTLWSADPFETFKQAIILVTVTIYAGYLVLRFPLDEILELVAVVFTISAVVNLAFIAAFPQFGLDALYHVGAWNGVFAQKNGLGFAALVSIPILIVAGRSAPRVWRFVYYLAVPLQVALLIGSESKTMLVATIGSVGVLFVSRAFRGRRTLKGAVILSLLAMSIVTVAVATANLALLADWLDKDITLTGRIPLWEGLIPIAMERPIFGYGYKAAFGGYFSPVHEVWVSEGWEPSSAHNALLHAWLEMGVIGVTLYAFSVARVAARAVNVASSAANAVALWPLAYVSAVVLLSITESGMVGSFEVWLLFPIAAYSGALSTRRLASTS